MLRQATRADIDAPAPSGDLFGASPRWPSGLVYTLDFLAVEEESRLLQAIHDVPMTDAQYHQYTAKRRVASYGSSYDFSARQLRAAPAIPDFLLPLRQRVARWASLPENAFAQALITEYRPGTPLGWHRDALNYGVVAGVSLGGRCRMRFRPYPPRRGRDPMAFVLELAPRSAYVMRDTVRWDWQHSIPATPEQRWSITFRTLRAFGSDGAIKPEKRT